MNTRLTGLLADVKARQGSFLPNFNLMSRDVALYRAARDHERSGAQLRAHTVLELAKLGAIGLRPDGHLAGEHLLHATHQFIWGSQRAELPEAERSTALAALEPELPLEDLRCEVRHLLNSAHAATAAGSSAADRSGVIGWGDASIDGVYMPVGWVENHSIRDYAKLLRLGYGGLKSEIAAELARYPRYSTAYAERENFLRAADAICDAGITLGCRYADCAAKAGQEALAERCRRVPEHGAATFAEAVQALWFGHIITCAEDGINANSLGRLDQILLPYYRADLAAGRITREEALELLVELAVKLYLPYDVQAITLGGTDAEGGCAVNELSYLFLEATREFGEIRDLSVRLRRDTPEDFLRLCAELVLRGGGVPFFFNDDCFIPALEKRGIATVDARNYSPIGCIELTIPGRANPHAVSGWFNLLKILELTLFNGCNPRTGHQLGPATGEAAEFADFEALMQAFHTQMEHFAGNMIYFCRHNEVQQRASGPLPGLSLLTDDCLQRGRDITDGGAHYNYHSICLMGVPDTADALMVLKQLVFTEKRLPMNELLDLLRRDFDGAEAWRQQLLRVPKYGNGIHAVDALASRISQEFIALMDQWSEPGNQLFVHLFTFLLNISFGQAVGAMPDGRHAGEPLAYSLSAHQGRDLSGVTALLHSLAAMPHREAAGASAAILDLHPSLFEGTDAPELLLQLLHSALELGVGQMQWNVVSAEQLEAARRDPEHCGNIPVRVAGYSQLFNLIPPELQDHIIARYKHKSC